MRSTRRLLLLVLPATVLLVAVLTAFWSAQHALNRSTAEVGNAHQIGFTLRPLDSAALVAENPGFEPIAAANGFNAGAFAGSGADAALYLAGPGGLSIYSQDGTLRRTLRTGFELPVAPITAVAVGRPRGATSSQILIATAGAGLLLLEPGTGIPSLRQLLPQAPDARELTCLLPLASGDLLLGTRHAGLLLFTGTTLTPVRMGETQNSPLDITALAAVDSSSYLVGTRNAGLFFRHAGTVQHATNMPDEQVDAFIQVNGKAFAGTPMGVAEFNLLQPSDDAFAPQAVLAPGMFSHALGVSRDGLLVGTLDQGIHEVSLGTRPRIRRAAFPIDAQPLATSTGAQRVDQFLSRDGEDAPTYALADGALLSRTDGHAWTPALTQPMAKLSDRNISALAFTPDGALYVGFFDHGLDILQPDGSTVRHREDDHLFCINRLMLDPVHQTMSAATANGLVLFDRQGTPRQVMTRRDGLISDHVTDIAYTGSGFTLATPAGLTFVTAANTESLYAFQGLVNNHVYTLATSGGTLFAGTLGGLSRLEGGAVRRNFTASNSGLKHNWITAIAPTGPGMWLVGTYGAGLETTDGEGHFAPVDLPADAPHDLVINPNAVLVTRSHIYAGTLGHGMLVFDQATQRWSLISKGFPSLNVTAFAEREGQLYVGTENGLVRIAESRLGGRS